MTSARQRGVTLPSNESMLARVRIWTTLGIAHGLWLACAGNARAGNDDELLMGNDAALVGGAVTATVKDASSIWYNPAGLGAVERGQIDVSGTAYTLRAYSVGDFLSTRDGDTENGAVTAFVSIPTQIAFVRKLADGVVLGLGYFVPHAENFVLREGLDTGSASDGTQTQISVLVAEVQHMAGAALGWALAPRARVGVSVIGGYGALTEAVSLFSTAKVSDETRNASIQSAFITNARISVEAGVGLQLELGRGFVLGVSCRGPRLQLYENIDASETGTIAVQPGNADTPALSAFADNPKRQRLRLGLLRAGRAGAALAYRHSSGWIAAELDVQPGLHRPELDVARKAVVNARLGVYQRLLPSLALGAGLFTDRRSEAMAESLLFGSGDFYGVSVGVELSNEHRLDESEVQSSMIFSTVFALRYAFSYGDFGRVIATPDQPSMVFEEAHGSLHVHELGLYVGSGLQF